MKQKKSKKRRYFIGIVAIILGIILFNDCKNIIEYCLNTILFLFGVSLLPILYDKILFKINIKNLHIILPIMLFSIFCLFTYIDEKMPIENNNYSETININNINKNYKNLKKLKDLKLKENFIKACNEINMKVDDIKNLKQIDDWNSGIRYSFDYQNNSFILYAYDNNEIASISLLNDVQIYREGYEPYNVNDYLMQSGKIAEIQVISETSIKQILNYPNTAIFKWNTTAGYSRYKDIYVTTGKFTAKNAFGVETESQFYIELKNKNANLSVIYMVIDGKEYIGNGTNIIKAERKKIENNEEINKNSNNIILKEGQLGNYGKEDSFNGEKHIRYYIPAGKYEVEAITRNAQFFIETIATHKESGNDTATTIKKITLTKPGDKETFEINSSQCILLVINTQIKLTQQ